MREREFSWRWGRCEKFLTAGAQKGEGKIACRRSSPKCLALRKSARKNDSGMHAERKAILFHRKHVIDTPRQIRHPAKHEKTMTDRVTKETRSRIMASVGTRDTGVEVALRKALHRLGYRYRIVPRHLPGKPDLVFPRRRKVVFVHGCFWHGHACRYGKLPKSRLEYWQPKIEANRTRDRRQRRKLRFLGWSSAVVWECSLKRNLESEVARIVRFLEKDRPSNPRG